MSESTTNEVTVTLKAGKGFEAPWIVYRGDVSSVFDQLAASVVPDEDVSSLTLAELTHYAAQRFQGINNLQAKLGATIIPKETGPTKPQEPPWEDGAGDPWVGVDPAVTGAESGTQQASEGGSENPLLSQIANASTLESIQALYVAHPDAFKDPEVQKAVTERRAQLNI